MVTTPVFLMVFGYRLIAQHSYHHKNKETQTETEEAQTCLKGEQSKARQGWTGLDWTADWWATGLSSKQIVRERPQ